jgi:hypothetical protein
MRKLFGFLIGLLTTTLLHSQETKTVTRDKELITEGLFTSRKDSTFPNSYMLNAFFSSVGSKNLGYYSYAYYDGATLGVSLGGVYAKDLNFDRWTYEIGIGAGVDIQKQAPLELNGNGYLYFGSAAQKYRAAHKVELSSILYYSKSYGWWIYSYAMYSPFQKFVSVGWQYQTDGAKGPKVSLNITDPVKIWGVFEKETQTYGISLTFGWEAKKTKKR